MNITDFLNFFASINYIAAGIILLLLNKRNSSFRILLSLYAILTGITLFIISCYCLSNLSLNYFTGFDIFTGSFQAPIFILLTKNVLYKQIRFSWSNTLIFVYPLCVLAFLIWQFTKSEYHSEFVKEVQSGESRIGNVFVGLNYIYILSSIIYGVIKLRKNRTFTGIFYSRFEIIRMKWLYRYFLFHLITAPFAAVAFYTLTARGSGSYFGFLASLIYLYFLHKLISKPNIVYGSRETKPQEKVHIENPTAKDHVQYLTKILTQEKLFLSKEITLHDLAKKLDITPIQLDAALLSVESKNFKDYLNSFRLEHSRELIADDQYRKYTIDFIADLSGFSSRTVFYELFKKQYNSTPLQLRKSLSNQFSDI